ncbi:MAG: DUF1501 domain-containing protein [Gemmataceae bacterium]
MLHLEDNSGRGVTRRTALKVGFLGALGLTLADVERLRASGQASNHRSIILVWLDGGPSHFESYDPKPEAPIEYRGPTSAIRTSVPGIQFSSLFPRQAKLAHRMAIMRSMHHDNGDHFAAGHWMLTGKFGSTTVNPAPMFPSLGSYIARLKGPNQPGLPAYVGLPSAQSIFLFPGYMGAAYLGQSYNPFQVDRENVYLHHSYKVRVGTPKRLAELLQPRPGSTEARLKLAQSFDSMRREVDRSGVMDAMDRYQRQAVEMVLGPRARVAFDLDREDQRLIDRYGDNPWGRYTLMARRLVEAGVTFVTVDMPHWDHHANLEAHCDNFRVVDTAVSALIEDLETRGLLDDTLVVVMGEFGRTPKINTGLPGDSRPGRDHWGQAFSVMLAGGGLQLGQVVGATNPRGEHPVRRALMPHDLHATIYRWLGIDYRQSFTNHSGRPIPILERGEPIREIL